MEAQFIHSWNLSPSAAVALQKDLRSQVHLRPFRGRPKLIAGADVSFNKYSPTIYAGFVVLDSKSLTVVDRASAVMDVEFPYVSGLLSFREIPPLMVAWKNLKTKPDVVVVDGQGIAHPRRLGIASHLGLFINIPTIGCAKSLLTGQFVDPEIVAGSTSPLVDRRTAEQIGIVLRTKNKVKPVFISPGHLMDFKSALRIVQSTVRGYRLPEPTRQAHLFVNEVRVAAPRFLHRDSS